MSEQLWSDERIRLAFDLDMYCHGEIYVVELDVVERTMQRMRDDYEAKLQAELQAAERSNAILREVNARLRAMLPSAEDEPITPEALEREGWGRNASSDGTSWFLALDEYDDGAVLAWYADGSVELEQICNRCGWDVDIPFPGVTYMRQLHSLIAMLGGKLAPAKSKVAED